MAANWQDKRPFKETNWHMLQDHKSCDVTFLTGSNKTEIKAHKFMLGSRSPVFYAMFFGEMPETSSRIEITDIETDTMNRLLRFIYTENCTVTEESVMAVLYAAKKYGINRLEQKCRSFLSDRINPESVCDIFNQANMFEEIELKRECFAYILANGKQVFQTEGFTTLSREHLKEILKSKLLKAPAFEVYNGCKKWAIYQLQKSDANRDISDLDIRNELGDMFHLIRFSTMPIYYFNICSKEDILTSDEKISIFQTLACGEKPFVVTIDHGLPSEDTREWRTAEDSIISNLLYLYLLFQSTISFSLPPLPKLRTYKKNHHKPYTDNLIY